MMRTVLITIGTMLLLAYLAVCGFIYADRGEMAYAGDRIVVLDSAELHFVREADVRAALRKADFTAKGKYLHEVDTYELGRLIERNPLVRRARCYHTPDSLLRIDIEQRHPIMRVKSNGPDGDFYIDTEGQTMPAQPGTALRLPLVTGHVRRADIAQLRLYDFARFLQRNRFWRDEITQIHVDGAGEVTLVPRVGSHVILMGSLDGYEKKLDRLMTFYQKVMPRKGWNAYDVLNLKFDGQVVAERAKG